MVSGGVCVVQGGSGGVWGAPERALFPLLEVEYSKRFGSKHYIMDQLENVYWVGITDPFLVYWGPLGAPKRPFFEQMTSL